VPVTPAAAGSNGGGGLHITTSQGIFSPTGISVLTGGAFGAPTPQSSTPAAAPQLPAPPPSLPPPLHPLHTTSPPPVLLPIAAPGTGAGTDASTRKTRIICTLGPASGSPEMLQGLLRAGMNVARFNFSHGTHADHADMLARLRAAEAATGLHCCYLLDTKGPEIRTGRLQHKTLELKAGQTLLLRTDLSLEEHTTTFLGSTIEGVSVDYPRLGAVLRPGSVVKIDDGLIVTRVIEVLQPENGSGGITGVRVRVDNNAVLGERKGVNLPGTLVDLPAVTARDRADLRFGVEQGFHLVAASFMRSADAVRELKQYLLDDQIAVARARNQPQEPPVHVIAKIEVSNEQSSTRTCSSCFTFGCACPAAGR
jgi:pyruvate kinase